MALPQEIFPSQNGSSSSSSSGHRTDVRTDGRRSVLLTLSGSEGGRVGPSEGGRRGNALAPCDYCGEAELQHECQEAWRWREPIPEDTDELALYLAKVWGIRNAELVALETGAYAVRDALLIIWRGGQDGRRYENPAGLIVKLARRLASAAERQRRRSK